jgi:GAF domain-containing protein
MTRELLDVDVAVLSEIHAGHETARRVDGEWPGSMLLQNDSAPLEDTICQRLLDGRIENYIGDVKADDRVNGLAMSQQLGIGAWLGVPIRLSDVQLYMLCCLAREARPSIGDREVRLLAGLAESVAAELHATTGATHQH